MVVSRGVGGGGAGGLEGAGSWAEKESGSGLELRIDGI